MGYGVYRRQPGRTTAEVLRRFHLNAAKIRGGGGGPPTNETNQSQVGLEATALAVKVALSTGRLSVGNGATCQAKKVGIAGAASAEMGLRALASGLKVGVSQARAEVGLRSVETAL